MMNGVNMDDYKIDTTHEVVVTHLNDPHSFYIRPTYLDPNLEYVETQSLSLNPQADSVLRGMVVLYRSRLFNKFVRGIICVINPTGNKVFYDIFAIDYGCFENTIPLAHVGIPNMIESIAQFPPLAIHCRLNMCEPIGKKFTDTVIENFKIFLETGRVMITVRGHMQYKLLVEIRTTSVCDLASLMCMLHFTLLWKPNKVNRMNDTSPNSSLALKSPQFRHKMLETGASFRVRVQHGVSYSSFYVIEKNESLKLADIKYQLGLECQNKRMQYDHIVPGKHCAVKVDDSEYERAIITEITEPGHKVKVILVDWGNELETQFTCIRTVTAEAFFNQPIMGIYCTANPDQAREYNMPKWLKLSDQFVIKITELGFGFDKPHKVYLYPVVFKK